jgi:hypothetical protein
MREPGKNSPFLFTQETATEVEQMGLTWLVAAAIITAIIWQIPIGNYILYPFSQKLEIFANGSGVAHYTLSGAWGYLGIGLVAAAGPMGPPIAGASLIMASRSWRTTSLSLKILGGFLLLSTLIWVRSWFGLVTIPLLGLMILAVALKTPIWVQGFAIQFLGVQACISTYHQLNYLFSYTAGPLGLSDTGQMQRYLFLPYWFWGLLMAMASLMILVQSLRIVYSKKQ